MRTLLFIALILLGKAGSAQLYFSDTTTNGSLASNYRGMVVENDSSFFMLGLYTEVNPNLNVRLLVSERKNQQIVNQYIRGRSDVYYFMYDLKKYDSLLVVVGTIPGPNSLGSQNIALSYLLLLNSSGDSLLYKEYSSGESDVALVGTSVVKVGSEIWLAANWLRVTTNSVLDRKVCLLRLDSLGNEKARYIYGNTAPGFSQTPRGLDVNANNEIIVAAGDCQGCLGNGTPINQAWIFAVDTSGQLLRQYFTPPVNNRGAAFKSSTTADGGAIFSAVKIHSYPQPNGSINYRYQGSVIKLNSQLQLEWDSIYGIESLSTNLAHVVPDKSGGYVAVGTHSNPNHPRVGWMTKLNAQGEMQWQRFFLPFPSLQDPQWGYLEHVAVTELGNIVAAGRGENHTSALDHAQYAWIIKTDSMGCLVPGCAVSLRELTTEPVYLKAWPNPVSEVLNVLVKSEKPLHGAYFKLIDMVGRTQRQWEGSYEELQYQIAVHDLPAGMYFLQLIKDGQLLTTEKVIKQ